MSDVYILFPIVDVVKRRLLFLFLPRKQKIKGMTCRFLTSWWSVLCLKESGWGPPTDMELVAHQRVLLYLVVLFYSLFRKSGSELSCFYFLVGLVFLVRQVKSATIKPTGAAM